MLREARYPPFKPVAALLNLKFLISRAPTQVYKLLNFYMCDTQVLQEMTKLGQPPFNLKRWPDGDDTAYCRGRGFVAGKTNLMFFRDSDSPKNSTTSSDSFRIVPSRTFADSRKCKKYAKRQGCPV